MTSGKKGKKDDTSNSEMDYEARPLLKSTGAIPSLLALIQSEYPVIQEMTLKTFARATVDVTISTALREMDALGSFVSSIGNPEWNDLHVHALTVIANLLEDPECAKSLVNSGGLQSLLHFITDRAVYSEADLRVPSASQAGKDKGAKAKKASPRRSAKKGKGDDSAQKEVKPPSNTLPEAKIYACEAVMKSARQERIRKILHDADTERMLIALLSHEDEGVRSAAAQAAAVMATSCICQDRIAELGGLELLIRMTRSDHRAPKSAGVTALAALTTENAVICREVAARNSGIEALVSCLHMHDPEIDSITCGGLTALTNLATEEVTRQKIIQSVPCKLLVPTLNSQCTNTQAKATLATAAIVSGQKALGQFCKYGGIHALVSLLDSPIATVRRGACWAVFTLGANADVASLIAKEHGIQLLQAMNVSVSKRNQFSELALQRILDANLEAKFALTGYLDFEDQIGDRFFDPGHVLSASDLLTLVDYCEQPLTDKRPIFSINIRQRSTSVPPNMEEMDEEIEAGEEEMATNITATEDGPDPEPVQSPELIDEDIVEPDEQLIEWMDYASSVIIPMADPKLQATELGLFVSMRYGGSIKREDLPSFRHELKLAELRCKIDSNVVPMGHITLGGHLHRALLFKFLADYIGLPTNLVRGNYGRSYNEILVKEDHEDPDTFRILLATDNHLGFAEKDGVRGSDSFKTFEEILHLAQVHNADFILFGGDIFHDNRPSMKTLHETMSLLRKYCLGNKPVPFEFLCDPSSVFANTAFPTANHLDGNLNVSIPVFAIHGNHDDPNGPGGLCAIDLLNAAGVVNLIGKTSSVESISVSPLLLRKGTTRLAIYGLGAMREERAHRLFLNNMVTFLRPNETADDWFSMCAVHQNRVRHGPTGYLPEHFLPNFLDLVLWGHEHECRIDPEWNSQQNFYVIQPGSSVATSLSDGEARDKAIGLLEVRGKEFKVTKIPLQTVRPFVFEDIVIEDELTKSTKVLDVAKQVESICIRHVETVLTAIANKASCDKTECSSEAALAVAGSESSSGVNEKSRWKPPVEPLIRMRVDISGDYESFSSLRFGQKFIGRVANPKDLITFNRNREKLAAAQAARTLRSGITAGKENGSPNDVDVAANEDKTFGLDVVEVEKLIEKYLTAQGGKTSTTSLEVFTTSELGRGLRQFIDKDTRDAIHSVVDAVLDETVKHLRIRKCPEEHIAPDIAAYCQTRGNSVLEDDTNLISGILSGKSIKYEEDVQSTTTTTTTATSFHSKSTVAVRRGARPTPNMRTTSGWSSDEDTRSQESEPLPVKRPVRARAKERAATSLTLDSSLLDDDVDEFGDDLGEDMASETARLVDTIDEDSPPSKSMWSNRATSRIEPSTSSSTVKSRPGRGRGRGRGKSYLQTSLSTVDTQEDAPSKGKRRRNL